MAALRQELAEVRRIARHFAPARPLLRATVDALTLAVFVIAIGAVSIALTDSREGFSLPPKGGSGGGVMVADSREGFQLAPHGVRGARVAEVRP